jgi:predicted protein tyrosine phosphatase
MTSKKEAIAMPTQSHRPSERGSAGRIHVCPLHAVPATVSRHNATLLLTCLHDDTLVETPHLIAPANHLRLIMHDIAEPQPNATPPNEDHIARVIGFAQRWNGEGAMVVHCWAGISRSTAAAFISLCAINPQSPEALIARRLRAASPTAQPNRLMIRLADSALGRDGRMVEAIEGIGQGMLASEAVPFSLPAVHGAHERS